MIRLSLEEVADLAERSLRGAGASSGHAAAIAEVVTAAEADECASHGLHRITGYVATALSGAVDVLTPPSIIDGGGGIVRIDARRGFAPLSLKAGRPILLQRARQYGVAALAISNCAHFSALWIDIEPLAEAGIAALACTIGQRRVALPGGVRPVLGTNPIAFAWPRPDATPFVFDFATSVVARGEIELRAARGEPLPENWAIDAEGQPTLDPASALRGALLTFGGYKGAALSIMVELLAGALTGEAAGAIETDDKAPRLGGTLIVAFDPGQFDAAASMTAERLFAMLQSDGKSRMPSARRHEARERSHRAGVLIPRRLHEEVVRFAARQGT